MINQQYIKGEIESNYYEVVTNTDGRLLELVLVGPNARDDARCMTKTI